MHGVELLTRYLIELYFYATNDSIMHYCNIIFESDVSSRKTWLKFISYSVMFYS